MDSNSSSADPSSTLGDPRDASNLAYVAAQDRMALLSNYYRWIARRFRAQVSGTVLELGCGAGWVVDHYVDRARAVIGVDVDAELVHRLEARHPGGKVSGRVVDLRGAWEPLEGLRADVVVALDVLEHFADDGEFLEKVRRVLASRGSLVLKVPAQTKLFGPMDEASGHYRRYDEPGLRALLEKHGFETLELRHMNPVGAWGYRWKRERRTNFSRSISPAKLRLANALMPLFAALDYVPGLKGLSLIGVFRARA